MSTPTKRSIGSPSLGSKSSPRLGPRTQEKLEQVTDKLENYIEEHADESTFLVEKLEQIIEKRKKAEQAKNKEQVERLSAEILVHVKELIIKSNKHYKAGLASEALCLLKKAEALLPGHELLKLRISQLEAKTL